MENAGICRPASVAEPIEGSTQGYIARVDSSLQPKEGSVDILGLSRSHVLSSFDRLLRPAKYCIPMPMPVTLFQLTGMQPADAVAFPVCTETC